MIRRRRTTGRTNPHLRLIGLATIIVIAGVFYIAFTANSGLPWQRNYTVHVDLPSALRLGEHANVEIAGQMVGQVAQVQAEPRHGQQPPYARLTLNLEPSIGPLPRDSQASLSPASALGENYLSLTVGHSRQTIPNDGSLPFQHPVAPVLPTDLAEMFSGSAARSFRQATAAMGVGLAGRGTALNDTFASLAATVGPLTRVMAAIASPNAHFADFMRSFEQAFGGLAPVANQMAGLIAGGATTFGALASARNALGDAIQIAPGAELATTHAMEAIRPALTGLVRLSVALRPAGPLLRPAFTEFDHALIAGRESIHLLPGFSRALAPALRALEVLSTDRNTPGALRKLSDLAIPFIRILDLIGPAQEYCNIISLPEVGEGADFNGVGIGSTMSVGNITVTSSGAQGENFQSAKLASNLNENALPIENQQQCQAGNEPFDPNGHVGRPTKPTGRQVRITHEPPGVRALAQRAGLLTDPETHKLEKNLDQLMTPAAGSVVLK